MDAILELKILSDSGSSFTVGGYGVRFGDADVTGDRFTKSTDFWFDRITQNPPVLYQHGQDSVIKKTAVGRVTSTRVDDLGVWVEAQITAAKQYADAIRQLIAKGVLGWSSGSVPHLVQRVKSSTPGVAEITSWPIVEFSLTPTPAEPRTIGVKELKALAAVDPLLMTIAREAEQSQIKEAKVPDKELPDSAFAFTEHATTAAKRSYPHHGEDGTVDADLLDGALIEARRAGKSDGLAHLLRHAKALTDGGADDAHADKWADGTAPLVLSISAKLAVLAEDMADDRVHMEHVGLETKSGGRLDTRRGDRLDALITLLADASAWAKSIERGEDGKARVDLFRHRLAMLELEEVS